MEKKEEQQTWVCLEEEDVPQAEQQPEKSEPTKPKKPPKRHKHARKKHRKRFRLRAAAGTLAGLAGVYCLLVFSHIPFIEKWRTIYIETAMGTMTHQWLATAFLPQSVIDDVMNGRAAVLLQQQDYNSTWEEAVAANQAAIGTWDTIKPNFEKLYSEIDSTSFWKYLSEHSEDEVLDDGYLLIDEADYDAEETGIKTIYGDDVCAIDTRNGIVIVSLSGDGYQGKMAIIKDPEKVSVAAAPNYGKKGSYLREICKENHAVLGINASGFDDPEGSGNGGDSYGIIQASGKMVHDVMDMNMKVISLSSKNQLNISNTLPEDARDAVQFSPALVVNGEQLVSGSSGWGLQPRSVIGQRKDGQILMAIVDGRQPGYSIGITLGDLTDIIYQYGAFQACNLDGGSSAIMYYNGREITHSSAATPEKGRHIPDAWIVSKAE